MPDGVIAWDTCILIDAIQKTGNRWGAIAPMVNLGTRGDLKIVISTLSVAEGYFLREMAIQGASQLEQNHAIEQWLEHSFLVKRAADFGTCKVAAELCRGESGALTPSDAIVIATALRHNAASLITYDDKSGESLLKLDGKFPNAYGTLRICRPEDWTQDNSPQLFDTIQV